MILGSSTGTATLNNEFLNLPNAKVLNINGVNPIIASSSTGTLTLFNTGLTIVNAFGEANTLNIGNNLNNLGKTTLKSSTVLGIASTQNLWNTVATTVNAFGAATTTTIGSTGPGYVFLRNTGDASNLPLSGALRVAGGINQTSDNTNYIKGSTTFGTNLTVLGNSSLGNASGDTNTLLGALNIGSAGVKAATTLLGTKYTSTMDTSISQSAPTITLTGNTAINLTGGAINLNGSNLGLVASGALTATSVDSSYYTLNGSSTLARNLNITVNNSSTGAGNIAVKAKTLIELLAPTINIGSNIGPTTIYIGSDLNPATIVSKVNLISTILE